MGQDCASGYCASFAWLKQDYCQPLMEGACPVNGFTYGEHGDFHALSLPEPEPVSEEVDEKADKADDVAPAVEKESLE